MMGSNRKFEISSPIPDHLHRSCWKSSEINEDSPIISDHMHRLFRSLGNT